MSVNNKNNMDSDLEQAKGYLTQRYNHIKELKEIFSMGSKLDENVQENLVVTDLFVEKDIQILSRRSKSLRVSGELYYKMAIALFLLGTSIALWQMIGQFISNDIQPRELSELLQLIIKPFTAYGLLVLTAVTLWKQSKAMLDQAERILEKRRANRVLRLFIYLHKGEIDIDELERILNWGTVNSNAFSAIAAEGKAPLGSLMSDLLAHNNKLVSDILKQKATSNDKKA